LGIARVGTAAAEPGTKGYGLVEVSQRGDGTAIGIPVIIVNGKKKGPTLCVSAGIHGNEYPGMEAIRRVARALDPQAQRGTLISVPVVNTLAFEAGKLENPVDHKNLNRVFPGKVDGTLSERVAYTFFNEVVKKADYWIDLHSAGTGEVRPLATARRGYETTLDLAKAAGFDLIWMAKKPEQGTAGMGTACAIRDGIPATVIEAGGGGRCAESHVQLHLKAVTNLMKHLDMIEGEPELPERWTFVEANHRPCVSVGGFFRPIVEAGATVRQGDTVAQVADLWGQEIERLEAPCDGIILFIRQIPSTQPGALAYILGQVLPAGSI
jgi:predicted deacylase